MKIKEGGFVFHYGDDEIVVYQGRRCLGSIVALKESSGRHSFRLGFDARRTPRSYRGRVVAAQALQVIDALKRQADKEGWLTETLILRSWDEKPQRSNNRYESPD